MLLGWGQHVASKINEHFLSCMANCHRGWIFLNMLKFSPGKMLFGGLFVCGINL